MSPEGPLPPTPGVRPLEQADLPRVAGMLARAFADDPTTTWLFPSPRGRAQRLERWYLLNVMALWDAGEGWVTEDLSSVALWLPTGSMRAGRRPHLGRQLWLSLRIGAALGARLPGALRVNLRVHARHPRETGWYLAVLGTEPSRQGRGLGSAVLAPVLRRCDEAGLPSSLDTVTEADVSYYGKRGFQVVAEVMMPGAPHFRVMRRPPQPPSPAPPPG